MKKGFTLAEVLITLGIIGVVAAITIPTLVYSYKTKAWNTASAVLETKIEAALRVMNTQQTLVGYKNTKDFLNEFSKHMKITRICDTVTDCMEEKVTFNDNEIEMSKIKTAKDFGQDDWDTEVLGVQFANGTVGAIAYNPTNTCRQDPYSNTITGSKCIGLLYDTSGVSSPNTNGKDLRGIQINKLGASCGAFEVAGTCYGAPFVPTPTSQRICKTVVQDDGFKYQKCYYTDFDYWTGASIQCGGQENMPTTEQLREIATKIYGKPVGEKGTTNGTRNDTIAASYGLNAIGGSLTIWSNNKEAYETYTTRTFRAEGTSVENTSCDNKTAVALCIVKK